MRRVITALASLLLVLVFAPAAGAHPDDPSETPEDVSTSENLSLVEHHYFPEGSDMYFQRREGRQLLDGQVIDETRDYAFVGGDGSSSDVDGAMHVFDVTDPQNPVHLVAAPCQGYHAEVVVYENLMVQAIDSAGQGCTEDAAERFDPRHVDEDGVGLRIWDVTDPANPIIQDFIGPDELDGGGVHNLNVHAEEGLLYLASSDFTTPTPRWGYIDLTDPQFPVTLMDVKEITPNASAACHDMGLDYDRDLAFCAAVEQTFIWDISDPRMPSHVSTIANPDITIHHGARLAPDGTTLVVNDELAGAAFSPGCLGTGSLGGVGALWFYDTTDPSNPTPMGSFSTTELSTDTLCTSHFYNFIPNSTLLVVGWYESGVIVVDYENPSQPVEHAFLRPGGAASFWSGYYWHGYLYGASRTLRADGNGGGFWVAQLDGVDDREPWSADEGTSWGRWTSQLPAPDAGETNRFAGSERIATSVEISRATFPDADSADEVVLARSDEFADALTGTPLAYRLNAPLLLTRPNRLVDVTAAEIDRVLEDGARVTILGGPNAIAPRVKETLEQRGYETRRLHGPTRVETAVAIAEELDGPDPVLLATGHRFPDAMAAGAAAARVDGAVLLTSGEERHPATDDYLEAHSEAARFAIGGPAVEAHPEATSVQGPSRQQTAIAVAERFFDNPPAVGVARSDVFADALTGGVHAARNGGPVLLTPPQRLHHGPAGYLCDNAPTLARAFVYGGPNAIQPGVLDEVDRRIDGTGC